MDDFIATLPHLSGAVAVWLLFLTTAFVLASRRHNIGDAAGFLRKLSAPVLAMARKRGPSSSQQGTRRRGLSIQVTDRAVARRALVRHGAAFLDRPTTSVPSTILTRGRHHNVLSAPYGPYWRAVRGHLAAGVLHPSRLRLLAGTRARALGVLVRALGGGAPAGESLHFKHPDLQRKLRVEVEAVVSSQDGRRAIEAADLSRMPYLKAVVLESLRRHPPVPFVLRNAEGPDAAEALGVPSLPDGGGATVTFLVGKIGRDAAAWSDPMAFAPERFMPGGEGEGVDLTCMRELRMMPFGAGRRICPGLAPGMLYVEYFVANLVREFEWREADGEEVDLAEFHGSFFTVISRPLRARLVPRDAAAARPAE